MTTKRRCATCQTEKSTTEFYAAPNRTDQLKPDCIVCYNARQRERYATNPRDREQSKAYNLYYKFKLTPAEYAILLNEQGGVCAICGNGEPVVGRSLAVDHDHESGKIRSLLCSLCNKGLGAFRDDMELTTKATAYLRRWKDE